MQSIAPTRATRRQKKSQQIAPRRPKESKQLKITKDHERSHAIQQEVEQELCNLEFVSRYACRARWPDCGRMLLLDTITLDFACGCMPLSDIIKLDAWSVAATYSSSSSSSLSQLSPRERLTKWAPLLTFKTVL